MIPDKNLRTAIEEKLGKTAGQPITQAEMTTLMGLNAMAFNISDLTGLQFATQLTSLSLDNNNISDITPLAGLTQLTGLNLDRNNISDITPLAGLTQLTTLWLAGNPLNAVAHTAHIPAHQSRGATVYFDPPATFVGGSCAPDITR